MVWAIPTYLFVASLGSILAWGAYKAVLAGGHPHPVLRPPRIPRPTEAVTLWLLLRAFASGCTAMTGVEAVSNGVNAFDEPKVRHAHGTLAAIVIILGLLLLGIAHVAGFYGVMAIDQSKEGYQSVLSKLVGAVSGRGWFYYVTIGSVLAVLCLSAKTSFVGFPRLCHLVAEDGFLPAPFAVPGRRLVYSVGILFLAAGATVLLVAFDGITDRLIPLFAVGAFLSFTLSQAGMAAHWWHAANSGKAGQGGHESSDRQRAHIHGSRAKLVINGVGAVATGLTLSVILAAKFVAGAWVTVIVIPGTIVMLRAERRYYDAIDREVLRGSRRKIDLQHHAPPVVLVPIKRWDRLARKAFEYALRLSSDVTALHVIALEGPGAKDLEAKLRADWRVFAEQPAMRAGIKAPKLRVVSSEYRSITTPVLRAIEEQQHQSQHRQVTVILPELVEGSWWSYLMHTHRERKLRARLLRYGGQNVVVSLVPWQLQKGLPAEAIAEEEPTVPSLSHRRA
jgi:Amino acid permease